MFCRNVWAIIFSKLPLKQQFQLAQLCRLTGAIVNIKTWPCEYQHLTGGLPFPWLTFMLCKYPGKEWNFHGISGHSLLTWEYMMEHLEKPWDWSAVVALCPNLTPTRVQKLIDIGIEIDNDELCQNPSLPFDFLLTYGCDWKSLSCARGLTWDFVKRNLDKNWSWRRLSERKCVTVDVVEAHLHLPWRWDHFARNPNVTVQFVERFINKDWNWVELSSHCCLTLEFVRRHKEIKWSRDRLRSNSCFPFSVKIANCDIFFPFEASNPTWEDVLYRFNKDVFYTYCNGRYADWEKIVNCKMFNVKDKWLWYCVSVNPFISWSIVAHNMDFPWRFDFIHYKRLL